MDKLNVNQLQDELNKSREYLVNNNPISPWHNSKAAWSAHKARVKIIEAELAERILIGELDEEINMSLKHYISIKDLQYWSSVRVAAFEGVAKPKHYKALYEIQKAHGTSFKSAITKMFDNAEFAEDCIEFVNRDENYKELMENMIGNYHRFSDLNLDIPTREADFMIEDNSGMVIWFYIEERIEISKEDNEYMMSRLLVDEFSNTLLYNNMSDGWNEYKENSDENSLTHRGAVAYKNYLAEKELLGE